MIEVIEEVAIKEDIRDYIKPSRLNNRRGIPIRAEIIWRSINRKSPYIRGRENFWSLLEDGRVEFYDSVFVRATKGQWASLKKVNNGWEDPTLALVWPSLDSESLHEYVNSRLVQITT